MDKKAFPYIILLGLVFGVTLVVSRFSVDQFKPATYIGLRLMLASFCFVLIFTFRIFGQRWPRGKALWGRGLLMGVFGTAIPMLGIVSSLQYLSSGLTSILITVNPALTVLMAHFILDDESLNRRKGSGVLLALSGAVLLAALGESGLPDVTRANPVGYLLVLGGMLSGSVMTVYARKYMRDDDTLAVTGIRMFAGAVTVMPLSLFLHGFDVSRVDGRGLSALIFAAFVGTFLGFLLSLYNIQRFGATAAVMMSYTIPVVTSIIGYLVLDEEITWGMGAGIVFVILGVWLINSNRRRGLSEPQVN